MMIEFIIDIHVLKMSKWVILIHAIHIHIKNKALITKGSVSSVCDLHVQPDSLQHLTHHCKSMMSKEMP